MNLQEMGAVFRQEREKRGLSVEDVVQRTKISRRNVLALEAGRKDDLPHPVYAKGFVRNYARLLGLDPEELAAVLAREYSVAEDDFGNDPTRDKPISMTAARSVGGQGRRMGLRGMLLVLLAAILGGAVLWGMFLAPRPRPALPIPAPPAASAPQPAPAPPAVPAPVSPAPGPADAAGAPASPAAPALGSPAPAAPSASAGTPKPAPAPVSPPAPAPAPKPAPAAALVPSGTPKPTPAPSVAAPAPVPAEQPRPAPVPGSRVMDIRATQLCWVNAEVDGTGVLDMLLQPGESKAIHFDKALIVKFGNAGGVQVTLDHKPFPLKAQSGEVRTVTIP